MDWDVIRPLLGVSPWFHRPRPRSRPRRGARGSISPDLAIRLERHPLFPVAGHGLSLDLPIAPREAVLGAQIELPSLERPLRPRIRPGVRGGQKLRLAGKGLPRRGEGAGGL